MTHTSSTRRAGASLRRALMAGALALSFAAPLAASTPVFAAPADRVIPAVSDADLAKRLGDFKSAYADVNGTRIHYVIGGKGPPLVLMPGWLQTWWEFNKVMPELSKHYTIIAVDIRGMGGSAKPAGGYDKKTMAGDIYGLVRSLGYEKANIAGHDIGAMVAYAYAANYPQGTIKLALIDTPHPAEGWKGLPMIPPKGSFGAKVDDAHPVWPWWFALNQVPELPEELLLGRYHLIQDWSFNYMLRDNASIPQADREIYFAAYNNADAIRGGNGWYRSFAQDIDDEATYGPLKMPVLALGGIGYPWLQAALPPKAPDLKLVKVENSGHFVPEEQPQVLIQEFIAFFR